jgi:hypothetical protein
MSVSYRRMEDVEALDMDGEPILLDQRTFTVTKLNETGGFIWESLAETRTREELVALVSSRYDADREAVSGDLDLFLKQMMEIGLIEVEE